MSDFDKWLHCVLTCRARGYAYPPQMMPQFRAWHDRGIPPAVAATLWAKHKRQLLVEATA